MIELTEFREQKDHFFETDHHSPLSQEQKRDFRGLNYFPENPALRFETEVTPFTEQIQVQMQTSTGELQEYLKYAGLDLR